MSDPTGGISPERRRELLDTMTADAVDSGGYSTLRDRIADALRTHTYAGKGAPGQACASEHGLACDCPETCVCGASFEYWTDHFADVAAGVVGPEIAERDADLDHANGRRADLRHAMLAEHDAARTLRDTLARVRELHPTREVPAIHAANPTDARAAYTECATCRQLYPCPTIRTVDGSTSD